MKKLDFNLFWSCLNDCWMSCDFCWKSCWEFQWESCDTQWSLRQDQNKLKLNLFISEHDYCRKNNLYFKYDFSNHLIKNYKFSFKSDWMSVKNDNIKSQFYKMWVRKHTRIQILHASSLNNNNKSDHDVHIIIDEDYKSDSDKSYKYLKN